MHYSIDTQGVIGIISQNITPRLAVKGRLGTVYSARHHKWPKSLHLRSVLRKNVIAVATLMHGS